MGTEETIMISYFKADSREGEALLHAFRERMAGALLRGHPVRVVEVQEYKMTPAILACFQSDVVIFDGSIEDSENRQYRAALELMKHLDYVLVVSRTALPFNFSGMRRGGAPERIATGTTAYCPHKTNGEILGWLLETLGDPSVQLPRTLKMQLPEDSAQWDQEAVMRLERQLLEASRERCARQPGVFVSYLSRYSRRASGEATGFPFVEDLFDEVSRVSAVPKAEIRYFPPGEISLECMTGQRRFEVVSVTEDFLAGCKAFWIYETPDYASSWWTYGERVSLARIFRDSMDKCPDIYTAKPVKKPDGSWGYQVSAYLTAGQKRAVLPQLTREDELELTGLYINSHPDSVAYEHVEKMRQLAKLPDFLLKIQAGIVYEGAKLALGDALLKDGESRKALEELKNVELLKRSARSYAYTKEFWEAHIVECPQCKAQVGAALDPESFMHFSRPYFYRLSPRQHREIIQIVKNGQKAMVKLPCGHTVRLAASGVTHRWWTVRSDVPTGPDGQLVEAVDFVSFA